MSNPTTIESAAGPRSLHHLVRCSACNCEITPKTESPEKGVCGVCLVYLEDLRREEHQHAEMVQVTREMAHDAGFPEMEGTWINW
jgi:hypothetical protein